jgi:enoyl-CoA hydratase/carnithine racemase
MNFSNIVFEEMDSVARITFNRPDVRNALNPELLGEMIQVVEHLSNSDKIRALIITGTADIFSGGADLNYLENDLCKQSTTQIHKTLMEYYGKAALSLRRLPFPVIAAVNGPAVGAGFDLSLNCDMRVAGKSASMGSIWVRICTIPALGGMYLLPRIVGYGRASEMIFSGDIISADEAYRIGLVNHVYEDDQLQRKALELANRLAKKAPGAVKIAKNGLNRGMDGTFSSEVDYAVYMQGICLKMDDCREGIQAFKEKREPKFTGK